MRASGGVNVCIRCALILLMSCVTCLSIKGHMQIKGSSGSSEYRVVSVFFLRVTKYNLPVTIRKMAASTETLQVFTLRQEIQSFSKSENTREDSHWR